MKTRVYRAEANTHGKGNKVNRPTGTAAQQSRKNAAQVDRKRAKRTERARAKTVRAKQRINATTIIRPTTILDTITRRILIAQLALKGERDARRKLLNAMGDLRDRARAEKLGATPAQLHEKCYKATSPMYPQGVGVYSFARRKGHMPEPLFDAQAEREERQRLEGLESLRTEAGTQTLQRAQDRENDKLVNLNNPDQRKAYPSFDAISNTWKR